MNRVSCRLLIIVMLLSPIVVVPPMAQAEQVTRGFTIQGNVALWTVAIKADKTADFELIMSKLREGLSRSAKLERRQQVEGWKVMRVANPLPDGTIAYVHIIDPVVAGADYTIMEVLYDEFPDERQVLYELYRGSFAKNLSLASGTIALDLSAPVVTPAAGAPSPAP